MSVSRILDAPVLPELPPTVSKFHREREAFRKLLPILIPTHQGEYVAIHEGRVVGHGSSLIDVAMKAYATHGYVPIYVDLITDAIPEPIRIPSPRIADDRKSR